MSINNENKYMIIDSIYIIVNILLFAFKYVVGLITGLLLIMTDVWHHKMVALNQ